MKNGKGVKVRQIKTKTHVVCFLYVKKTYAKQVCACIFQWHVSEKVFKISDKICPVVPLMAATTQQWPFTPSPMTWKLRPFGEAISWLYKKRQRNWKRRSAKMEGQNHLLLVQWPELCSGPAPCFGEVKLSRSEGWNWIGTEDGKKKNTTRWQAYRPRQRKSINSWLLTNNKEKKVPWVLFGFPAS